MPPSSEPIQAYYKLSFPNFEYYLQTLSVTIGRRPVTNRSRQPSVPTGDDVLVKEDDGGVQIEGSKVIEGLAVALEDKSRLTPESAIRQTHTPDPQSSASSSSSPVDVDLGPLKSVSRLHARIDYDEPLAKFVLSVQGRNGAWVDGEWIGCGGRVALGARTKIQIATRTFYFVLPPPPTPPSPLTPDTTPDEDREPTPIKSRRAESPASSSHSHSPARSASPNGESSRKRPSISASPPHKRKGKSPLHIIDPESDDDQLVSLDGLDDDELDNLEAMDPDSDDYTDAPETSLAGKGKGKGKGKGRGRGKLPGKGKGKLPAKNLRKPFGKKAVHVISSKPPKLLAPPTSSSLDKMRDDNDPNQPKQPRKYNTARSLAQSQLPPRPPPDQMPPKPPYTYAILCYRAINSLGGKASLSEIVNWIREKYEWYRWNDQCGWESSVRHNLSSNPAFLKSRRDAEVDAIVQTTGQPKKLKGFFWSVDPKSIPSFEEKEKEYTEMGNRAKMLAKGKGKEGVADASAPGLAASNGSPSSSKMTVPVPRLAVRPPGGIPVPPMAPHMPMMMSMPMPPHPPPLMHSPMPGSSGTHNSHPIFHQPPPTHHPPKSAPTQPVSMTDVCLPIIVGPAPTAASSTQPSTSSGPFIDGQPITLHAGTLYLNPTIFSGLTLEQLTELQKLKAASALEILQGYIKSYLKEQMMKKNGKNRKNKMKANSAGTGDGKVSSLASVPGSSAVNGDPGSANNSESTSALIMGQSNPTSGITPEVGSNTEPPNQSHSQLDPASILALANLASASAPPPDAQSHVPQPPTPTMPTQMMQHPHSAAAYAAAYYSHPFAHMAFAPQWPYPPHPQFPGHPPRMAPFPQHMMSFAPHPPAGTPALPVSQQQMNVQSIADSGVTPTTVGSKHSLEVVDGEDGGSMKKPRLGEVSPPCATTVPSLVET